MAIVLAVGIALRVAAHVAYPFAFFYPDGEQYVVAAYRHLTNPQRPIGYSAFIKPFVPGNYIWIAAIQHVMVIAFAVVCYVYLVRRGVRPWIAALALAPFLLGPTELVLEHYVLAEALFTVLTIGGLIALTRSSRDGRSTRRRLTYAAAAGLLLAYAAVTRTVGLPICGLGLVYLLIRMRSVGWQAIATYVVALAVPLFGYMAVYDHQHGVFALGQFQGRFLYARSMTIADCSKLPADDQNLCQPVNPADRWPRNEYFVFAPTSPATIYDPSLKDDPKLEAFALDVIKAQPLQYAEMVVRETAWYMVPAWRPTYGLTVCANNLFNVPASPNARCAPPNYIPGPPTVAAPVQPVTPSTATSRTLAAWGKSQIAYGPLMGLALLALLVVAAWRFRRGDRILIGDGLLFGAASLGLMVVSVAASMYEIRYSIPSIPIAFIGLALAVAGARRTGAPALSEDQPVTAPEHTPQSLQGAMS